MERIELNTAFVLNASTGFKSKST